MEIKRLRRTFDVTPTVDTSVYASGDAIAVLQNFGGAVRSADQAGILKQLVLSDIDNQSSALDIVFYQEVVAGGVDNAAYAPSAAEIIESVGLVSVAGSDYVTIGSRSLATIDLTLDFQLDNSTALFFQVVSRGTPTYTTASSLQFKFVIEQD